MFLCRSIGKGKIDRSDAQWYQFNGCGTGACGVIAEWVKYCGLPRFKQFEIVRY